MLEHSQRAQFGLEQVRCASLISSPLFFVESLFVHRYIQPGVGGIRLFTKELIPFQDEAWSAASRRSFWPSQVHLTTACLYNSASRTQTMIMMELSIRRRNNSFLQNMNTCMLTSCSFGKKKDKKRKGKSSGWSGMNKDAGVNPLIFLNVTNVCAESTVTRKKLSRVQNKRQKINLLAHSAGSRRSETKRGEHCYHQRYRKEFSVWRHPRLMSHFHASVLVELWTRCLPSHRLGFRCECDQTVSPVASQVDKVDFALTSPNTAGVLQAGNR